MKKSAVLVLFSLLSLPLLAQDKAEVFGGYQYLHLGNVNVNGSTQPGSSQSFNGWDANAAFNFSKYLGVEGDFGGAYASVSSSGGPSVNFHVYTYTGGPVVSADMGVIKPFAHVLFGGARLSGSSGGVSVSWNGYTMMVGGGVDARINRVFAFRVAQVDWLYYHFGSQTIAGTPFPSFSGSGNVRIATGIVARF